MAKQRFHGFVGFVGGGIDTENVLDESGECVTVSVYRTREEAETRYEDVRKIEMIIEPRAAPETEVRLVVCCPVCDGTGGGKTADGVEVDCSTCDGEGGVPSALGEESAL